jgi:hypothetical protein
MTHLIGWSAKTLNSQQQMNATTQTMVTDGHSVTAGRFFLSYNGVTDIIGGSSPLTRVTLSGQYELLLRK